MPAMTQLAYDERAALRSASVSPRRHASKGPRLSERGFYNQEDCYPSAMLRAAIPLRASERGILADPRESDPTSAARSSRDSFPKEKRHHLVPGVRLIRQAVAAEINGRDMWLAQRETQF